MSSLAAGVSPSSRRDPPPYQPPSPGDRLFYLLLTVAASTVVYKSFPKNLRGIATIGVASFGIYHAFGLNCDRIKQVVSNIFGNFPGGGSGSPGGGFIVWERFTRLPWDTGHVRNNMRDISFPVTGSLSQGERQEKRRTQNDSQHYFETRRTPPPPVTNQNPSSMYTQRSPSYVQGSHPLSSVAGGVDSRGRQTKRTTGFDNSWIEETDSPSSHAHRRQPSSVFSSSRPNTTAVDSRARQAKRREEVDSSWTEETDTFFSHEHHRQPSSVSSLHSNTGGVDGEERQGKRKGKNK